MRPLARSKSTRPLAVRLELPEPDARPSRAVRRHAAQRAIRAAYGLAQAGDAKASGGRKSRWRSPAGAATALSAAVSNAWSDGLVVDSAVAAFAADPSRLRRAMIEAGALRRGAGALALVDGPAVDALISRLGEDPRPAAARRSEPSRWRGPKLAEHTADDLVAAARRIADEIEAEGLACFAAWARTRRPPFDALTLALAPQARGRAGPPVEAEARRRVFAEVAEQI